MKKIVSSILALVLALTALSGVALAEVGYTEKALPILRDKLDSTETATVRFYEDLPNVPYMSVTDFYNIFELTGTELTEGISFTREGDKYTYTTVFGDSAEFDIAANTIYFDNVDRFVTLANDMLIEQNGGVDEDYPFAKITETAEPEKVSPKTISLSDYHMNLRVDDTGVYLPLPTLADLFATPSAFFVVYAGEKIYTQDRSGAFQDGAAMDEDPDYLTAIKADRPADLAEYTYNELCLSMDLWYGKPGQEYIHNDLQNAKLDDLITEKYPEIKEMLLAKDFENFYRGLSHVFYGVLFDGGHTGMATPILQSEEYDLTVKFVREVRAKDYGALYEFFCVDKQNHQEQRKEVREAVYHGDYYAEQGDTAMIHFDHFEVDNDSWIDFYAGKGERPLEDDTVGIVLYGLERAAQNPEIKNIIIDISCNGGGNDTALLAIEWLFTGLAYIRDINMLTNQINTKVQEFDMNFDGKFDENDISPYTKYHYGVLTSDYSFSCANAFAWFMHEHGVMILGQQSGGGACAIRKGCVGGIGIQNSCSTSCTITENGGTVDFGCPVDANLLTDGDNSYANFYDLTNISNLMNEFFAAPQDDAA